MCTQNVMDLSCTHSYTQCMHSNRVYTYVWVRRILYVHIDMHIDDRCIVYTLVLCTHLYCVHTCIVYTLVLCTHLYCVHTCIVLCTHSYTYCMRGNYIYTYKCVLRILLYMHAEYVIDLSCTHSYTHTHTHTHIHTHTYTHTHTHTPIECRVIV